jgi:tripartite-type tricarboxylate transporter receptor subunit TctC
MVKKSTAFLGLLLLAASALAQNSGPSAKPIRLIVPYAPGGPIDVTARVLAERVKDTLGTVIIENRPGA